MQPYRKPLPYLNEEEKAEFWSLVDASAGPTACWPWLGKRHARGYGNFNIKGKVYRANRIALFLATGEDPGHSGSCHSCDNPPCCNPEHLFAGDQGANAKDMMQKGRGGKLKGDAHPSHLHPENLPRGEGHALSKLTDIAVIEIRTLFESGKSKSQLARDFSISHRLVRNVIARKTWKHI